MLVALTAGALARGEAGPLAAAAPSELPLGAATIVSGTVTSGAETALALEASPYPFHDWKVLAATTSTVAGAFAFPAIRPSVDERLRVADGSSQGSPLTVTVDPRVALASSSLGPGRVRLSARIAHAAGLDSPPVTASWYLADPGSTTFHLAATTTTRELPGAVTYASTIVDPPARRFLYRVCLNPAWEAAMGPAAAHGRCPARGFHLPGAQASSREPRARAAFEFGGEGRGTPLAPFPSPAAIQAAQRYLEGRAGRTALAVVDSSGRLSGWNTRAHFQTASVVKVMFLTAYLQMLVARHRALGAGDRALLYPMIHESNNEDASAVLAAVGAAAVARVAREAGMQDYAPGVGWWAYTQTSAADQARFFMRLGSLIPARYLGYARYLMSTIEPEQSWGMPVVARPAWAVYFKTGALPSEGLFNEVALLERGPVAFTVAVFTDGEPSQAYGEETIAGVGARLLEGAG